MPAPEGFKALVLDIECIPARAWVWGYRDQNIPIQMVEEEPRMICFAAKWLGAPKKTIEFHAEWGPGGRSSMLEAAHSLMCSADAVIGYNSKGFDNKWIKSETAIEGFEPISPYKDIDLYTGVKSQFRFPSYKLEYVAKRFKLGAKTQHSGWGLWRDVIDRDPSAMKLMEKYNKQDVFLTEKLHDRVVGHLAGYPNVALYSGSDGCRKCGGFDFVRRGMVSTSASLYQTVQCKTCRSYSRLAAAEKGVKSSYRPV